MLVFLSDVEDHMCTIDYQLLRNVEDTWCDNPNIVSSTFSNVADDIRNNFNIPQPSTYTHCLELYFLPLEVLEHYF